MKKTLILMTFAAAGISGAAAQPQPAKKVLVAYYSYGGNTRVVAEQIRDATGGDLFEIVPEAAYPADYDAVVAQARKEIEAGVRPALKTKLSDAGSYDVIFVGSLCWWATVAPPVATFLAENGFKGKTVVPFMTHEGSRMGRTVDDVRKLCPGATVREGLPVRGSTVKNSREEVLRWVRGLGYAK